MLRRNKTIRLQPDDDLGDIAEETPILPQQPSVDTQSTLLLDRRQGNDRRSQDDVRTEFQRTLAMAADHGVLPSAAGGWSFGTKLRVGAVALALMAGGGALWLATQHDAPPVAVAKIEPVAVPTTHVLVAKTAIGLGQRLSGATVEWQDWPQSAIRSDYITDVTTPDALTSMSSSVARDQFVPGEPILAAKLVKTDEGFLSAVLANGMRGVAVTVAPDAASGGFVLPNDHVDVLLTRTTDTGGQSVQTILQNVRVLAINAHLGDNGAGGAAQANTDNTAVFSSPAIATLELSPTQSEVIVNAIAAGRLSLVLRSLSDSAATGDPQEAAANQAIRMSSPFWNHTVTPTGK